MSISGEALRALAAAGATTEMIIALVEADAAATDAREEARLEAKRANNAERQRRFKAARKTDGNADNALPALDGVTGVTGVIVTPSLDKEIPPRPPKEINSIPASTAPTRKGHPIPEGVTAEQWASFTGQRKKKLNDRAYGLLCGKLETLARDGWPPGEMIDRAIEHGWETVFPPKGTQNGQRPANDRNEIINPITRAAASKRAARSSGQGDERSGSSALWS